MFPVRPFLKRSYFLYHRFLADISLECLVMLRTGEVGSVNSASSTQLIRSMRISKLRT